MDSLNENDGERLIAFVDGDVWMGVASSTSSVVFVILENHV